MATERNLILARLDGTAGRGVFAEAPVEVIAQELRKITTDPELLGTASGHALAGYLDASSGAGWAGKMKSEVLDAAGADPAVRDEWCAGAQERQLPKPPQHDED